MTDPIHIDGSQGEGGGQLLRTAVALAAITGRPLRIEHIRARRPQPGLAAQHLAAVRAVGSACNARFEGVELRSTAMTMQPGRLCGGGFAFDVGTAGSITLVLQALLPVLACCGADATVTVGGGTDVTSAPPLDYFRAVTLALLARMGLRANLVVHRRGYYPRGGGQVTLRSFASRLRPVDFTAGSLRPIRGVAHVAGISLDIGHRMRKACLDALGEDVSPRAQIELVELGRDDAVGKGGAIVAWCDAGPSVIGCGQVAQRGILAERLGQAVGSQLRSDLAADATLDVHAADQVLIYLALAGGGSFTTRRLSTHAQTAVWLIEQFLPVRFDVVAQGALVRVRVARRA